jgi:hypothetical protein
VGSEVLENGCNQIGLQLEIIISAWSAITDAGIRMRSWRAPQQETRPILNDDRHRFARN